MRAVVVLLLTGCWTNDARPTTPPEPVVHYEFHAVHADVDHGWRATIVGEHFTIAHDGQTIHGTLAHGPRALDFRTANDWVILACRRTHVDVHPAGADFTVACDDAMDGTPAWSEPAQSLDAWSCLTHASMLAGSQEVIFVENMPIELVHRACCVADDCGNGYEGYRRHR